MGLPTSLLQLPLIIGEFGYWELRKVLDKQVKSEGDSEGGRPGENTKA